MKICIATTTFYKSMADVRALLALKMIEEVNNKNYNIVAVDGGSCPEFYRKFDDHEVCFYDQEKPGMGASRRQAIREASKVSGPDGAVLWMEPEKWPFVAQIPLVVQKIDESGADLVVPSRMSFYSYPRDQQSCEELGNLKFRMMTGRNLDVWFGPRLIGPRALPQFLDYNGSYGDNWDSIFTPVIRAIGAGLKVVDCRVDYVHPPEQTAAEEADPIYCLKRQRQLDSLLGMFLEESRKLGLIAA